MITDIHCHFVPDEFFRFVAARDEFAIKVKRREGDIVDLDIRGMHFGLNTTFFDLGKQIERMQRDGVERTILSLATPFIDYHLDASIAVEAARVFNDALAGAIRVRSQALRRLGRFADARSAIRRGRIAALRARPRILGGHIASNVRGVYLNDAQFEPIVRAATDLNVPLFDASSRSARQGPHAGIRADDRSRLPF